MTAVDPQGASDVGTATIVFESCKMTSPLNLRGLKLHGMGSSGLDSLTPMIPMVMNSSIRLIFGMGRMWLFRGPLPYDMFFHDQYQTYPALVTASDGSAPGFVYIHTISASPQSATGNYRHQRNSRDDRNVVVKVDA